MSALAERMPTVRAGARGRALVVDGDPDNRRALESLLAQLGFAVETAVNGLQAVELAAANPPDMVFMEITMPVMDGYEAVRRIKAASEERFIPVIFLTAVTDESGLTRCIDAGGDDFLTRPFEDTILASKVRALERIRGVHEQLRSHYQRAQRETEIAEAMYSRAVASGNVARDSIGMLLRPAATFSGDLFITAHAPSGDLHVLFGDFTGHGLAAALGALPAAEVFRAMTAKGFSIVQILDGINAKLNRLLPTGMFMAAEFVCVHSDLERVTICNCGMPDALIVGAHGVRHRIGSGGLPLGILPSAGLSDLTVVLPVERSDLVVLASDGVLEARDPARTEFGAARFESAVLAAGGGADHARAVVDSVARALERFNAGVGYDDDVSLVAVPCSAEVLPAASLDRGGAQPEQADQMTTDDTWSFELTLEGSRLRRADPVPLVIGQILEFEPVNDHAQALFTVLSELFVNALDHGVLGLDSALKDTASGFARYLAEREKRLAGTVSGWVRIAVRGSRYSPSHGELTVTVTDSGPGFDWSALRSIDQLSGSLSGRGMGLVRGLCRSLTYHGDGNVAEAVYAWS